jgi:hypothetical protein
MTRDTVTLLVLAGVGGFMLASLLAFKRWLDSYRVVRCRVMCPAHGTEAVVDFLVDARGPGVVRDVIDCSLLVGRAAPDCGKECRSTSVASFGASSG